jgi:hypothetical protein
MVDTQHLKCCAHKACGFKSRPAHHAKMTCFSRSFLFMSSLALLGRLPRVWNGSKGEGVTPCK